MDPVTIGTVVGGARALASIAVFLGLVESSEQKIDRLVRAPFGAGCLALRDAQLARGQEEQALRVEEALRNLRLAGAQEIRLRAMQAHIGVALCYAVKGDQQGLVDQALTDAAQVRSLRDQLARPEGTREKAQRVGREAARGALWGGPLAGVGGLAGSLFATTRALLTLSKQETDTAAEAVMLPGEKLEARRMEDLRQAITAHLRGGSSQLTSELWPNLYSPHR